jgi:hypothetical protein
MAGFHASLVPRDLIRELSVVGISPSSAAAPFAPKIAELETKVRLLESSD